MTKNIILSVIAVGAIVTAIFFANEASQSAAYAAQISRELTTLRTTAAEAEKRAALAEQRSTAMKREAAATSSRATTTNVTTGAMPRGTSRLAVVPGGGPVDQAQAQQQTREKRLADIESTNAALFRRLGFTSEQIEQFKTVKLAGLEKRDDVFRAKDIAAQSRTPGPDRAEWQKILQQATDENYTETLGALQAAFGDKIAQGVEYYDSTTPLRPFTDKLARPTASGFSPVGDRT